MPLGPRPTQSEHEGVGRENDQDTDMENALQNNPGTIVDPEIIERAGKAAAPPHGASRM